MGGWWGGGLERKGGEAGGKRESPATDTATPAARERPADQVPDARAGPAGQGPARVRAAAAADRPLRANPWHARLRAAPATRAARWGVAQWPRRKQPSHEVAAPRGRCMIICACLWRGKRQRRGRNGRRRGEGRDRYPLPPPHSVARFGQTLLSWRTTARAWAAGGQIPLVLGPDAKQCGATYTQVRVTLVRVTD